MRYAMLQRQFHVLAENDRHRALLEDGEGLLGVLLPIAAWMFRNRMV